MQGTDIIFEVETLIGKIRTTEGYWEIIKHKHPEIKDLLLDIMDTLTCPEQIRKSKVDRNVYIFYKRVGKYWLSIVTKKFDSVGFVITAYLTNKIKEGEIIWPR